MEPTVGAALITALITLVVSGPVAFYFGLQRAQRERLYEQRVAVIAELNRLLWNFQRSALLGTNPDQPIQVRAPWITQNKRAFTELQEFYFANTVWLNEHIHGILEPFFLGMGYTLRTWEADLDEQGDPSSQAGLDAAQRINDAVPLVRRELEPAFRAILFPSQWYEPLLQIWERLENRNRREEGSVPQDREKP
jgi:hypothetical protein